MPKSQAIKKTKKAAITKSTKKPANKKPATKKPAKKSVKKSAKKTKNYLPKVWGKMLSQLVYDSDGNLIRMPNGSVLFRSDLKRCPDWH